MKQRLILFYFLFLAGFSAFAQGEYSFQSGGQNISYRIFGKGEPLLILNGGPGLSSSYMTEVARELSDSNEVLLPDQRGTGKSAMHSTTAGQLTLDLLIEDIESLRKERKLESWKVLGHSWGGMLAMAYASKYPDRVKALILVGPGGVTLDYVKYMGDNVRGRGIPNLKKAEGPDSTKIHFENVQTSLKYSFFDLQQGASFASGLVGTDFNHLMPLAVMTDLVKRKFDLRKELKRFYGPVLIVQGRQDPIGESTAYQIKDVLPLAEIRFVEACGHFPWIEKPVEFYAIVRPFLTAKPTPWFGMKRYWFVMLTRGAKRDQDSTTAAQLQKGHLDNITRLYVDGKIVVAGPFGDDGIWRGIFIFDAGSEEEVRQLLDTDPAIKAGRLAYELHPWWGGRGSRLP